MSSQELYAALRRFDEEYIPFPPFIAAVHLIEAHLKLFRETGIAQNLLVLGESGAGKSSLCKWLAQKYPRRVLPDRDVLPVLVVPIPPAATIASMVEVMLTALGDQASSAGTASSKTMRAATLCRACRVEIILFDEAQHLYDRGLATTHYMVADWIKSFIDQTGTPTVFLGLPRLEQLLQVNEQLRRRFSRRIRLALGQSESSTIHNECLQLFISLGACLPVPLSCGDFSWEELGMRIYYASDGRVAYIKKILTRALARAIETESNTIGPEQLEKAFTEEIWWEGVVHHNPFNPLFEFRRLDRGNEPFELGAIRSRKAR
ncbi:MAG: TniB family NTP-binding protein [Pseudomonadota bacterium]